MHDSLYKKNAYFGFLEAADFFFEFNSKILDFWRQKIFEFNSKILEIENFREYELENFRE